MSWSTALFAVAVVLFGWAGWRQQRRQRWLRRLQPWQPDAAAAPWWQWPLPAAMQQHAQVAALSQPWLGTVFWSSKALLLLFALLLLWPSSLQPTNLLLAVAAALLLQMLPDMWLRRQAHTTLRDSRAQLPELLELLSLCLEAGLTLDRALPRLSTEITTLQPALARHLQRLDDDLRVVSERRQAFARLAERIPLQDFRQLSWLITQADEYGTPLAAGLRDLGQHSRTLHMLEVEEHMARVPGHMALPLMLFIIMPLVVLLAGPALLLLLRQLGGQG
ncbi:hypothetical protein CHH28_09165 [Bacterioplanes sanyensis]|uniref:Type II secretion system protein GspF domain-containing protein n=1 Tax=Bacterioplanes sanyensis TaxID=1249553 RepID=A0A222FJB7_9GAMM|nr:type II secretion system F family protein [Bacterioplanes sanyensis]ASP38839.1 hypothetical protein CHH28_09165 [Bacterioplanes sanyensis]